MTDAVEIIKVLLKDKLTLEILRVINIKKRTLEKLDNVMISYPKEQVEKSIKYLDSVALIENVFYHNSGSFYRISARGKGILGITEEAIIERGNTNVWYNRRTKERIY